MILNFSLVISLVCNKDTERRYSACIRFTPLSCPVLLRTAQFLVVTTFLQPLVQLYIFCCTLPLRKRKQMMNYYRAITFSVNF